jgi:integration host factor subunit alpha
MATINKKIIINKLHQKVGLSKRVLKTLIDELLEEIKKTLELGEETKIVRFGNFIPYETKKRKGRNFQRVFLEGCYFQDPPHQDHKYNHILYIYT